MTKQHEPDRESGRDRPVHTDVNLWEDHIQSGLDCIDRWADRYGVEDLPAPRELLGQILLAWEALPLSKEHQVENSANTLYDQNLLSGMR